jgi:ATP-dependent RNA helicase DHX57
LAVEQKASLETWLYETDPFEAYRAFQAQKAQAIADRQARSDAKDASKPGSAQLRHGEFSNCPEVKMAGPLRDIVEDAVKQVCRAISMRR